MSLSFPTNRPLIYLITRGNLTDQNFERESLKTLEIIRSAVMNGISLVQIREKRLGVKLVFELVEKAVEIARNTPTCIFMNERVDIALAAEASGVHLTSRALPTKDVRRIAARDFLIGVSTHVLEEAKYAREAGADFVTFSPIFATASKQSYGEPQGLGKLSKVCRHLDPFPVLALGGINETNYRSVLANGARGFAGITFLNDRDNLKRLAELEKKVV